MQLLAFGSLGGDALPHRGADRRGESHRVEQRIRTRGVASDVTDANFGAALALQVFHLNRVAHLRSHRFLPTGRP